MNGTGSWLGSGERGSLIALLAGFGDIYGLLTRECERSGEEGIQGSKDFISTFPWGPQSSLIMYLLNFVWGVFSSFGGKEMGKIICIFPWGPQSSLTFLFLFVIGSFGAKEMEKRTRNNLLNNGGGEGEEVTV